MFHKKLQRAGLKDWNSWDAQMYTGIFFLLHIILQQLEALMQLIRKISVHIRQHMIAGSPSEFCCQLSTWVVSRKWTRGGLNGSFILPTGWASITFAHLTWLIFGPTGPHQIMNYISWDSLHVTLVDFKAYKYVANIPLISYTNHWNKNYYTD